MNSFRTEPIVLSGEQFMKLAASLRRPDEEYMDRRDKMFAKMDENITIQRNGMDMEVDIPDLDLSFIDEMNCSEEKVFASVIETKAEIDYVIRYERRVFETITGESLITTNTVKIGYANSMERMTLEHCVCNQADWDKPEGYVKDKNSNDMQPCKTEQLAYAA